MLNRTLLLLRTVRHLRPGQVVNRLTRRWTPPPKIQAAPPRRPPARGPVPDFLPRPTTFLSADRFLFLNEERTIPPGAYPHPKSGLLWDYNFHYFDGLLAPSPTPKEKAEWVARWLKYVPVGARPAWDAYPTSRRIANWVKWSLGDRVDPPPGFLDSLATQARHLSKTLERHLLANHLLANAVALVAAGAYFGGGEGARWLDQGTRILGRELGEQFLDDGAHYELSPTYHALILEDLLDLMQVADATGVTLPEFVESTVASAVGWLTLLQRPDGAVPLFNDAAHDQAPDPAALVRYATRLLGLPTPKADEGLRVLAPSGHLRYRFGRLVLLGDVAQISPPYQPGHTHCDMLNFELCWAGRPLIVDTGTSTYEVGPRRALERGTASHNTVQMGRLEQSEVWEGFRVARRAKVTQVEWGPSWIRARIRAFPPRWCRLERGWDFEGESLVITDRVLHGPPTHRPTARIHFHPEVRLTGGGDHWVADGLHIRLEGAREVRDVEYQYAPAFNTLIPARCLEIDFDGVLRTRFDP